MSRDQLPREPGDDTLDRLLTMTADPPQLEPDARARLLARLQRSREADLCSPAATPSRTRAPELPMTTPPPRPSRFTPALGYTLAIAATGLLVWSASSFILPDVSPDAPGQKDSLATRTELTERHFDYLAMLPKVIRLPEFNAAVVHAGAFPGVSLEEQQTRHLLHIQNIKPPGKKTIWPSKSPADYTFWTKFWKGPERLIFGHTVLSAPLVTEHAVGIDTGAVFGHGLTAVILPEWKIFTLPTKDHSAGKHKRIGRYPVHGEITAYS